MGNGGGEEQLSEPGMPQVAFLPYTLGGQVECGGSSKDKWIKPSVTVGVRPSLLCLLESASLNTCFSSTELHGLLCLIL